MVDGRLCQTNGSPESIKNTMTSKRRSLPDRVWHTCCFSSCRFFMTACREQSGAGREDSRKLPPHADRDGPCLAAQRLGWRADLVADQTPGPAATGCHVHFAAGVTHGRTPQFDSPAAGRPRSGTAAGRADKNRATSAASPHPPAADVVAAGSAEPNPRVKTGQP